MIELLNKPINDRFYDLVSTSRSSIKLCAPFVKNSVIQNIYKLKQQNVNIEYISNFSLPNFHKKASDIEAFEAIINNNDKVFNCQMLHAKIYIFDNSKTIVTSANLTHSGFMRNIEYGVYFDDQEIVNNTIIDFNLICSNEKTGQIGSKNLHDIRKILSQLPVYHKEKNQLDSVNEVDDILEVDKNLISNDLSDWKKAMFYVVDDIEGNEFTLQAVYEKEPIFKNLFPQNNTVKDSMRRNLQELRDLGLIKFLGSGKYKKLWK